jgi:caa(3)-type oxidase subunit IV
MHSDPAEVQASVRKYMTVGAMLLVFTGITVAASYFNLAVPAAITVALIIAAMKGSMVAAIFMHLSQERRWIYGALLLTVLGFLILLFVPVATVMDTIGTPTHHAAAEHAEHAGH